MKRKYKIWSIEHGAWWKSDCLGYTPDVDEAGIYSYDEAKNIIENANVCGQFHECMIPIYNLSFPIKSVEGLLFEIYRIDKTPDYGYSKTKKDQTTEGEIAGVGKRWLTPREIIRNHFGLEFWDKYNEWKAK